jgi:integrase
MKRQRQRRRAASARFQLKDYKGPETLIYLIISIDRKRVKWSTGEKISGNNWSKKTNRGIVRARDTKTQALNERLDRYATAAVTLFNEWELNTPAGLANYNPAKYKQELDYRLGFAERPGAKTEKLDTSDFVRFAEAVRDHRKDSTGIVRGTWKVLNNHVNLLREFADLRHGGTVAFADVDDIFIDGFKKFLFRTKGHNRRTVHKVMVTLRSIASRAADRGLMTYGQRFRSWAKQDFRKMPQPALTRPELDKVIALDLSDAPRLERVRDLFLIGVATAQRWSDYSKLTPKNFRPLPGGGYRYFIQSQQKTSKKAGGPVMSWIVPTLEKYGYLGGRDFDPPKISGQRFNDYLKEVVKLAIPDVTITVYNDREQVDHEGTEFPKWEKISSHAARRTAVSLLRSMNAPDDQIQKMTGHTTLSEMDGYDVRDAETLALELGRDLNDAWGKSKLRAVKTA